MSFWSWSKEYLSLLPAYWLLMGSFAILGGIFVVFDKAVRWWKRRR